MKTLIFAILTLTLATMAVAAEPNIPNIDYEKRYDILQRRIVSLNKELDEVKKTNRRLRLLCRKNGIKIEAQKDEEAETNGIAEEFQQSLQVGQIAYLGKNQCVRIRQVADKNNMIVELTLGWVPVYSRNYSGESRFLTTVPIADYRAIKKNVWIKGLNTSGLVDGNVIKIFAPLKISGTKTYETVEEGTNTVFVLEPYIVARPD